MEKEPGLHTGLYDTDGRGITIGTIVRKKVNINNDVHGTWAEYEVKQQGMTPILSYHRSEKGQVLPQGYTASLLADEYDQKMFLFSTRLRDLRPIEWMVVQSQ
ncbi:MAG: hypothetical protein KDA91_19725 [Planctomycetaceae bacterium]|nr:hypothetical protein [Planctomycetaceae bacterium]